MATVEAARSVFAGRGAAGEQHRGGLHHAMPSRTSGFCVYNDVAVAIRWLLDHGCERVGYVDVDVHHGDGVQAIFYDDPRVMTVSLHETPACLFPGTGFPTETGGPGAEGTAVNVALPPGTTDAGWLRAFHAVVPAGAAAHRPQVLITQHGCDSHRHDPLADLNLSPRRAAGLLPGAGRPGRRAVRGALGVHRRRRATRCCTSCPGPGPTCSPSSAVSRWRPRPRCRRPGGPRSVQYSPAHDGRRSRVSTSAVRGRDLPGEPGRPGDHGHPAGGVPRAGPRPRSLIRVSARSVTVKYQRVCRRDLLRNFCTARLRLPLLSLQY